MEKTSSGTKWACVYGPSGLIAMRQDITWYYVVKDHLGSAMLVSNESDSVQFVY